jgi:UDP-hydrolysing UDP-N-acetyl-D-glucosamine 2-epimerase
LRTVGVVTVARSDFGACRQVLRRIVDHPGLRLHLIVGGMHLAPEFGSTVDEIEGEGFTIAERVPMLDGFDTPEAIAAATARGVEGFARSYARTRPDVLVLFGDRFEMLAAAVAALPFNIPIAHLHGGETTEGAIDEAIRHSITKMSHLHFVALEEYAQRVVQMGEAPWRVLVSGAPGLDNIEAIAPMTPGEISREFGVEVTPRTLLVTYHPATLQHESTQGEFAELLAALHQSGRPVIFTYPNADTGGRALIPMIAGYVSAHPEARVRENFGTRAYLGLMANAAVMVGNSSSGIIEAASFRLPVVDVGMRQRGRARVHNVLTVPGDRNERHVPRRARRSSQSLRRRSRRRAHRRAPRHPAAGPGADRKILLPPRDVAVSVRTVFLGAGGHARVLIEIVLLVRPFELVGLLDADPGRRGQAVDGIPVLGGDELLARLRGEGVTGAFVAFASLRDTGARSRAFALLREQGFESPVLVHPRAIVSPSATLGAGVAVLAGAVVGAGAKVGVNAIVNTAAVVEHDCRIGESAHVATGARLAGSVDVGAGAHVGIGAVVRQGIAIGERAIVGAGAVVVADVPAGSVVVGNPARARKP